MGIKKYSYVLIFILMLLIGANGVYAANEKNCFYMNDDSTFKASLTIRSKLSWAEQNGFDSWGNFWDNVGSGKQILLAKVHVDKYGSTYDHNEEALLNWIAGTFSDLKPKGSDIKFSNYYTGLNAFNKANKESNPQCPKYLVFQEKGGINGFKVWGTESESLAIQAVQDMDNHKKTSGHYASRFNKDGKEITSEEYYGEFVVEGLVKLDEQGLPTCDDFTNMIGHKDDDGKTYDPDGDGEPSIRNMIELVLQYVRIIVPILIILFGTLDFAKAVIAGKEDNMRKAQTDFVKRVLIGIAVFFVPLLVDVVMYLAEIVWDGEYLICNLD